MNTKIRRTSQACDNCSSRRVRCRPSSEQPGRCQHCADYDEDCTYRRPLRKRGAKQRRQQQPGERDALGATACRNSDGSSDVRRTEHYNSFGVAPMHSSQTSSTDNHGSQYINGTIWSPPLVLSQALTFDLVEIYCEVVYPVFPLFHLSTLQRRVSRGEHTSSRSFYASVMALCALSTARARDGAVYRQSADRPLDGCPSSESLFDAARSAIDLDAPDITCLDYMRAAVLLSITAIQYGNARSMNVLLGIYHTYVAAGELHNETNWPPNLSHVEVQERRRLFWSAYTLDVFTTIVWNGTLRSHEASFNVAYPEPIEGEIPLAHDTAAFDDQQVGTIHWLLGWNTVTDLYRILEHAVDHLHRMRNPLRRTPAVFSAPDDSTSSSSRAHVIQHVIKMYTELPDELRTINPISCDLARDLFGFQAANIQATIQLVRMVYLANDSTNLHEKCRVASDVITGFGTIPVAYLRAMSTPLHHHLGEIGAILGAAFREGMTGQSYRMVRGVLLELVRLLEALESGLCWPTGSGNKLRGQVASIDVFMANECRNNTTALRNDRESTDIFEAACMPSNFDARSPQFFHFPADLLEDWFSLATTETDNFARPQLYDA